MTVSDNGLAHGPDNGHDADLIVVGAGPAGAATAYHAAQHGLSVLLLEKTAFPREKVCGDGLTPRGIRGVQRMGIDTSTEAGWLRNRGLRIFGGGHMLELDWPELADWPSYGAVRTRHDLDDMLATQAVKAGAVLHQETTVSGPIIGADDRVTGVTTKDGRTFRAPIVAACDGVSGRMALALGLARREDRPMGVAYRRYFNAPTRTDDDFLESWLELWGTLDGQRVLLPGYGWVFGMGDGTANVGLGMLNSTGAFQGTDYRGLLASWSAEIPGLEEALDPPRGAALPMGFNRQPHYSRGLLLVGDAGGTVNPFNGEGIAYALETGELAADVIVSALAESSALARERALGGYPAALKQRYGGYYTLGRVFVRAIGHPAVMRLATQKGLSHERLMRFTLKLLANLTDVRGGDVSDRIINGLSRVVPAA